jgi:hypothetical protein
LWQPQFCAEAGAAVIRLMMNRLVTKASDAARAAIFAPIMMSPVLFAGVTATKPSYINPLDKFLFLRLS